MGGTESTRALISQKEAPWVAAEGMAAFMEHGSLFFDCKMVTAEPVFVFVCDRKNSHSELKFIKKNGKGVLGARRTSGVPL